MPSNHLILCRPLLLLPSIFPSIRVFSNESVLRIRWPKYRSFSFNISPSNDYSRLISFTMDWLDLLAVHRTLKSLLQHHSSKASILRRSTFLVIQLSHPHMTTGKTITLTTQIFVSKVICLQCRRPGFDPWVGKIPWRRKWQPTPVLLSRKSHGWRSLVQATAHGVAKSRTRLSNFVFMLCSMSLLFNTLSTLVITFLPKSKHLLISWLQSPSAVILEPPQNKV